MPETRARLTTALTGRYTIERELGAGGMATVYLAHDVKHDRKVALKVLRPELSAILGGERFLAEIKTTANLQHPHILSLFDSGEVGGVVYYVMPFVEGESLRDRLKREHQLPVDEAVRIATEVADALDYAHRHHVIHRDIKPENILLHDGRALVADFGIALAAMRSDGGARMTETGMSLGTPHYMSPEQAMGEREISARSDVYALGCVLYEMLVGEPPFTGVTAQAIIARVMTEEPRSLTLQRRTIPPHVEAAVQTALQKLPADRFATARAFAEGLSGTSASRPRVTVRERVEAPVRIPSWRTMLPWAVAVAMLGIGLAAGGRVLAGRAAPRALRMSIAIPTQSPPLAVRLSPDGATLSYVSGLGDRLAIYSRRLDELQVHRVDGSEDATSISFSPDGQVIAYLSSNGPRKLPSSGGSSVAIPVQGGAALTTLEFAGHDRFIVAVDGGLATLSSDGLVHPFALPDSTAGEVALALDQVLPDGWVLARSWRVPPNGPIFAIDPSSGRRVQLVNVNAAWSGYADGALSWTLPDGTLYGAPLDLDKKRVTGGARPLGATVLAVLGFVPPVTAGPGGLAYVPTRPRALVRVDRSGRAKVLLGTDRSYHIPRISPDGRRIALDFTEQERDVWLFDIADSTLTRFGFDSTAHDAEWLRDGSGLVFAATHHGVIGVYRRRFNAAGQADSIMLGPEQLSVHALTNDLRRAIGVLINRAAFDLIAINLDGAGGVDSLLTTRYTEGWPALSPDGRWLAYASDESGRLEVYVRAWPGMGYKVQISQNGGVEPAWSRDGRELFYRSGGEAEPFLTAAAIEVVGGTLRVRSRTPLFSVATYEFATPHRNYDPFPDGRSFAMVRQGNPGQQAEIVYLQNVLGLQERR